MENSNYPEHTQEEINARLMKAVFGYTPQKSAEWIMQTLDSLGEADEANIQRDITIFKEHVIEGKTFKQIADSYGLHISRVQQIKKEVAREIRKRAKTSREE